MYKYQKEEKDAFVKALNTLDGLNVDFTRKPTRQVGEGYTNFPASFVEGRVVINDLPYVGEGVQVAVWSGLSDYGNATLSFHEGVWELSVYEHTSKTLAPEK